MTQTPAAEPARLSPRKQRQSQPLADAFFGGAAKTTAAAAAAQPSATPSATQATDLFSSSPAFATPMHPIRPFVPGAVPVRPAPTTTTTTTTTVPAAAKPAILPILLPPATLRPLAFRTFTKKHNLTLTASALQALATFVGRHCGSGWREEGLAERVLEETARSWKKRNCGFIVDGASPELKEILKTLEGNMSGGRIQSAGAKRDGGSKSTGGSGGMAVPTLPRQDSLLRLDSARESDIANTRLGLRPAPAAPGAPGRPLLTRDDSQVGTGDDDGGPVDNTDNDVDVDVEDASDDAPGLRDPRQWLKVVDAFAQPRMVYNVTKKHFERDPAKRALLPGTAQKTALFRNRYHVIHQRLLRNELFQSSAVAEARAHTAGHKITPVANLLGRHGSHHMLLGLLVVLPTGGLALCDLSASIALDLASAVGVPHDAAWFAPGMIVLADGVYEEAEDQAAGRGLNGTTGVGGTLGGRFTVYFLGQPPSETRRAALGISGGGGSAGGGGAGNGADHTIGGGFGWIDFLGVGSHRAVGARMRRLEQRFLRARRGAEDQVATTVNRHRVVVLGEIRLDEPRTLQGLRKVLGVYAAEPAGATPVAFVLAGNFTTHAVMAGAGGASGAGGGGSIEYKEGFDALAAALADYPALLQAATFVFVPGDHDGWVSAFTAGAAVPLPRRPVPALFTSRVRRAFAAANAGNTQNPGEAVWTTNPSRLSLFGPSHEIVLFRDDMAARLRRAAVRLGEGAGQAATGKAATGDAATGGEGTDVMDVDAAPGGGGGGGGGAPADGPVAAPAPDGASATHTARKLVKTVLDQGFLAPFRPAIRPVLWDAAAALHLYPLPTALVLVDTTAPAFCVTYEGCHVMNPGSLLVAGRRGMARWVEYAVGKTGVVREPYEVVEVRCIFVTAANAGGADDCIDAMPPSFLFSLARPPLIALASGHYRLAAMSSCVPTMAAPAAIPVARPDAPTVQRRFAPLKGRTPGGPVAAASASASDVPVLQGVVFDVDGTLCLPQNYMFGQMRAALGISPATDILDHIYALPTPDAQHAAMEKVRDIERQAMARQQPQPGLAPLMDYLAARGVPKGICTRNFDTPVNHLLSKFLEGHTFAPIVTRDFRPPKPDPAGILHIARSWGLGGNNADKEEQEEQKDTTTTPLVMVGDSIDDMTAGRRAGAATVLLANDTNRYLAEHPDTDLVIDRLDDLINVLENGFVGRPVPQIYE